MTRKADNAQTMPPADNGRTISLRRKIQAGFLLAALMTVLTGGGLTVLLTGAVPELPFSLLDKPAEAADGSHERLLLRMRCWLAGGLLLVIASLAALYMFIVRRIVHPLECTAAAARQMVNGRLDAAVPVHDTHEIGCIGEMVNDMGVNLQELVLLVWNQTGSILQTIERIRIQLDSPQPEETGGEIQADLQSVRHNLGTLQSVVQSFDLYDVRLTGRKAVALEDHCDQTG